MKRLFNILNLAVIDADNLAQLLGCNDSLCRVLGYLQAVVGVEHAVPRYNDTVILYHHNGDRGGEDLCNFLGAHVDGTELHLGDVPHQDVAFGDGLGIQHLVRNHKGHDVRRMGDDNGIDVGMETVNLPVQLNGAAGLLAHFLVIPFNAHQAFRLQVFPVLPMGIDEEGFPIQPLGKGPLGAGEKLLVIGAVDQGSHVPPGGLFKACDFVGHKLVHLKLLAVLVPGDFLVGKGGGFADAVGLNFQPGAEVQRLKGLEAVEQGVSAYHNAVVFQDNGVEVLFEFLRYLVPQVGAAREAVFGNPDIPAGEFYIGDNVGIGNLTDDGIGHQRGGMGVKNRPQVGANLVYLLVKGVLGRGLVVAADGPVRMDADNILPGQAALVDAAGGDPDVPVVIQYGQVAAGCCGHAISIDTLHNHDQLVRRMKHTHFHGTFLLCFILPYYSRMCKHHFNFFTKL